MTKVLVFGKISDKISLRGNPIVGEAILARHHKQLKGYMNKRTKTKINYNNVKIEDLSFVSKAHLGHNVSHAKNRTARVFRRNLHRATVILAGIKHRVLVPTGVLRKLKAHGLTTHKVVG
mgnify:CR=1 FL=1